MIFCRDADIAHLSLRRHKATCTDTFFGMRLANGRLLRAGKWLRLGLSNSEVTRQTEIGRPTVGRLRRILETYHGGPFLCQCGRDANHYGVCRHKQRIRRTLCQRA